MLRFGISDEFLTDEPQPDLISQSTKDGMMDKVALCGRIDGR